MEYNDYELVALAKEQNEDAIAILYKKYEPIISNYAHKYVKLLQGNTTELSDLIQEGMIALETAINSFDERDNTLFYTFATVCIDRRIMTYIKTLNRPKHRILNEAISYDALQEKGNNILNRIYNEHDNPEKGIISEEIETALYNQIIKHISEFEKEVLDLRLTGLTYKEIATKLNKNPKIIDNALFRIKNKIKPIISKNSKN